MHQYLDLVANVLKHGVRKRNRTGITTISSFSQHYQVDLSQGFPLLTTKKMPYRSVFLELLWYLRGEDHIRWLRDEMNCHIWDAWAKEDGYVGPIYPVLWRNFPYHQNGTLKTIDQIKNVIELIKKEPNSRRMVVNAWHPGLLNEMALPPCHIVFIFNVSNGRLNCHLTQRSGDIALGIPFNMACYSALTMIIANITGLNYGLFSHTIVDAHIYENHIENLKMQLERNPRKLPLMTIANKDIDALHIDDFTITDYHPHDSIKFPIAV